MRLIELFNQAKLDEAIEQVINSVKSNPVDYTSRWNLSELLCFKGDLERADKQLDVIVQQDQGLMMVGSLFRQLIRAETARRECWEQGRAPELIGEPTELTRLYLDLWLSRREDNMPRCKELIDEIQEKRAATGGTLNDGTEFGDFRDTDDFCADFMEVLTSTGKYYWIPFDRIREMAVTKPASLRDLLWLQVSMSVEDGPEGEVYLPTVYLSTIAEGDMPQTVGLATDWKELTEGVNCGLGRRIFWADEEEVSIMELDTLGFKVNA